MPVYPHDCRNTASPSTVILLRALNNIGILVGLAWFNQMDKPAFESSDSVGKDRNNLPMISAQKAGWNTTQIAILSEIIPLGSGEISSRCDLTMSATVRMVKS